MKSLQTIVKYMTLKGLCCLKIGTCCVPLQKIKLWPLQLLTFNNPWKESRWTSRLRHSVIWNSHRAGQEIDNFWRRIYEPWFYILSYLEKHKFHWQLHFFWQWGKLKSRVKTGLPGVLSILKSVCQSRRHQFHAWSGKIPHSANQSSALATDVEPCPRAGTSTSEPKCHKYWSLNALQPVIHNRDATIMRSPRTRTKSRPYLLQLR